MLPAHPSEIYFAFHRASKAGLSRYRPVKNTSVAEKSIKPLAYEKEGIEHSAEVGGSQR